MPTQTRLQRADTHKSNFGGAVRRITGRPHTTFTDITDSSEYAVGAMAYSTDLERLYININGTQHQGWRYIALT